MSPNGNNVSKRDGLNVFSYKVQAFQISAPETGINKGLHQKDIMHSEQDKVWVLFRDVELVQAIALDTNFQRDLYQQGGQ